MDEVTVGELVAVLAAGPTSVEAVKTHLAIDDDRDDARLAPIVAAINTQVSEWRVGQNHAEGDAWSPRVVLGATMLAARLFARRNSPAGVEAFNSEGAVYVSRNDPDVGMLLGLGAHQPPTVG